MKEKSVNSALLLLKLLGDVQYMVLNGTIYYYERNPQNDVIGLIDSSMNEVVTYSY